MAGGRSVIPLILARSGYLDSFLTQVATLDPSSKAVPTQLSSESLEPSSKDDPEMTSVLQKSFALLEKSLMILDPDD